jgi:hypothetical protein
MNLLALFGTLILLLAADQNAADRSDEFQPIAPRSSKWQVVEGSHSPSLQIQFDSVVAGPKEVTVVRFRNNGPVRLGLSNLRYGPIALDAESKWWDFRETGRQTAVNAAGTARCATYPGVLYSPVGVLETGVTVLGVSVLYPVLEARHDVRISLLTEGADSYIEVGLSNDARPAGPDFRHGSLVNLKELEPGAEYTLTLAVRRVSPGDQALDAISAYREFFVSRYVRNRPRPVDRSPIAGVLVCTTDHCSPTNPRGWADPLVRPDIHGYGELVIRILTKAARFNRVVLWAPSGVNCVNKSLNFPFNILSPLVAPLGSPQPTDIRQAFSRFRLADGKAIGFWWGHSAEPRAADDSDLVSLESSQPAAYALCRKELKLIAELQGRVVGLDAFTHGVVPVWNLVEHLRRMQTEFPELQFCTEGRACDVLHSLAPTCVDAYRASAETFEISDYKVVVGRFVLADYLQPDHETWCLMLFDRVPAVSRTILDRQTETRRISGLGFVPVRFDD